MSSTSLVNLLLGDIGVCRLGPIDSDSPWMNVGTLAFSSWRKQRTVHKIKSPLIMPTSCKWLFESKLFFWKKNAAKHDHFRWFVCRIHPLRQVDYVKDDSKFIRTGFASCIRRIHPLMRFSKSVSMKSVCFLDVSYLGDHWTLQNRGAWLWKKTGFWFFF